jgi:hypothetical protein
MLVSLSHDFARSVPEVSLAVSSIGHPAWLPDE